MQTETNETEGKTISASLRKEGTGYDFFGYMSLNVAIHNPSCVKIRISNGEHGWIELSNSHGKSMATIFMTCEEMQNFIDAMKKALST